MLYRSNVADCKWIERLTLGDQCLVFTRGSLLARGNLAWMNEVHPFEFFKIFEPPDYLLGKFNTDPYFNTAQFLFPGFLIGDIYRPIAFLSIVPPSSSTSCHWKLGSASRVSAQIWSKSKTVRKCRKSSSMVLS